MSKSAFMWLSALNGGLAALNLLGDGMFAHFVGGWCAIAAAASFYCATRP